MQVDHVDNRQTSQIQDLRQHVRDLVKSVGRGATALRDESDNVLTLNPSADHPLLTATSQDVALSFKGGEFFVTDSTATQARPLSAGALTASTVTATGLFQGTDINLSGALIGNKLITAAGFLDGVQFAIGNTPIYCGDVHGKNITAEISLTINGPTFMNGVLDLGGQINMGVFPIYCGDVHGTAFILPSDRRLKRDVRELDEADLDALLVAPVRRWRWRETWDDGREHVGPMAQDVPESLRVEHEDGHLGIDSTSYTGALLALVQRQAAQIAELTARIEALEERCVP